MRSIRRTAVPVLLLALSAFPASAGTFELYGGYFSPHDDLFDEGLTYGLRGSWPVRETWSAEVSVGRWSDSHRETFGGIQFPGLPRLGGITVDFDLALTMVDLSLGKQIGESGWRAFGGAGWGFAEADAKVTGIGLPGQLDLTSTGREDSLSLHLGLAGRFPLGEKLYLRPDVRARWFTEGSSGADLEATVALGWSL